MASNPSGVPGALFDPHASNAPGGLSTGIGYGTNAAYAPRTAGMDAGKLVEVARIGFAPPYTAAQAVGYAGDIAQIEQAATDVAPGGTFPNGGVNRTGQTVPAGGSALTTKMPVESEVGDFLARSSSVGGSVSAATVTALDNFVKAAKASGYFSKIKRLNLFCGNNLAACLTPLVAGGGFDNETNVGFVAADYSEATGLKGNASVYPYLKTGFVPATRLTQNDTHIAVYNRSGSAAGGGVCIGAHLSNSFLRFSCPFSDGTSYSAQYDSAAQLSVAMSPPYGLCIATRTSSASHVIYKRGASVATAGASPGNVTDMVNDIWLYCDNFGGSPQYQSTHTFGGYSIGSGLTAADVTAYNTHMQAFQTALGRAV